MPYLIGIDLGTMFTAAAVLRLRAGAVVGEPEMLALADHGAQMPSVVFAATGELVFGDAAQRRALAEPDRVAREFTRRVGDPTPVSLGDATFSAQELVALTVRYVVDLAARRESEWPERIAITHPAGWGGHKLELLAGALAAHELTVTFLAEPEAAALCFAAAEPVAPGATIAVYDLGGGSFDAAVVRRDDQPGPGTGFTLLGRPEGVAHLGGADFDQAVFDRVLDEVPAAFEDLDESDPQVWAAVARVRRDCRAAKEALSSDTEASVEVWSRAGRTRVRLHRSEFEELIEPRLTESVPALLRSMSSAGLEPADPSAVLLVGGSARIPLVAQLVSEQLNRPVTVEADPKNAIAKGAALALAPRPAVRVPAGSGEAGHERTEPGRTDALRTGPIVAVPATERIAAWTADPSTRGVPERPDVGDSFVTRDRAPIPRRSDTRTRIMIGAGGLAGALAVVGAVLLWPTAPAGLNDMQAPSTAGPAAAATPPVTASSAPPVAASSAADGSRGSTPAPESGSATAGTSAAPATASRAPAAPAPAPGPVAPSPAPKPPVPAPNAAQDPPPKPPVTEKPPVTGSTPVTPPTTGTTGTPPADVVTPGPGPTTPVPGQGSGSGGAPAGGAGSATGPAAGSPGTGASAASSVPGGTVAPS